MYSKTKKRVVAFFIALVVFASCVISPEFVSVVSALSFDSGVPTLEKVKDQLDEGEIVKARDLTVSKNSSFESTNLTNIEYDKEKVGVSLIEAKNKDGEEFNIHKVDTYFAKYLVTPKNTKHPSYQVSRNILVKENEKSTEVFLNEEAKDTKTYRVSLVNENEDYGRISFADCKDAKMDIKANDKVTIIASPKDGYEVASLKVVDSNEKEIATDESKSNQFTFTMPSSNLTVSVSFVAKLQKEAKNTSITNYLKDNLDKESAKDVNDYSEKELKNVDEESIATLEKNGNLTATTHSITVEYTLANSTEVNQNTEIDDVLEKNPESLVGEYSVSSTLYSVKDNEDCFVAFINPGIMNGSGKFLDVDFVNDNTNTPTIYNDIISFDKETGIAYVPKSLFFDEDGKEIDATIRSQVLVSYDTEQAKNNVSITIDNKNSNVTEVAKEQTVALDSMDVTATFPLVTKESVEKTDISKILVYANGNSIPLMLDEDSIFLDPENGNLTIAVSPITLFSLRVEILGDTVTDKVARFFSGEKSYAISSADSMKALPNVKLTYSGTLENNMQFEKTTEVRYSSSNKFPHFPDSTTKGTDVIRRNVKSSAKYLCYTEGDSGDITNYLKSGKGELKDYLKDIDQYNSPKNCGFAFDINKFTNIKQGSTTISIESKSYDWLAMKCGHGKKNAYSDTAIKGQAYNIGTTHINYNDRNVIMKVLYVKANSYAVIGFLGPIGGGQASYAIYKIKTTVESGKIRVHKTDEDTGKALSGAVYRLYTNSTCSKRAKDVNGNVVEFTTGSGGNSDTVTIEEGVYYLKEYKAPTGYTLDDDVYKWTVNAGTTTFTKEMEDEPVPFRVSLKMKKAPNDKNITADSKGYVYADLDGAVYTLYKGAATDTENNPEASAYDNRKKVKDLDDTDEDGIFSTGWLKGLPAYNYYFIKETSAPDGYKKDSTIWSIYPRRSGNDRIVTFKKSTDNGATFATIKDKNKDNMAQLKLAAKTEDGKIVRYQGSYSYSDSDHFYSKEEPETFDLTFKKTGDNGKVLSGAGFTLYHCNITIDTPDPAGQNSFTNQFDNDKVKVTDVTTDSKGLVTINNLPINTTKDAYYLVESTVPTGYTKDFAFYYIHVWKSGGELVHSVEKVINQTNYDKTQPITENNRPYIRKGDAIASKAPVTNRKVNLTSTPIVNPTEKFDLKFNKTDENGKKLNNVKFNLYHCDITSTTPAPNGQNAFTNRYSNNKKLVTSATSVNGVVSMTGLDINGALDAYYITEEVPTGYTKDFAFYYLHVWYSGGKLVYTLEKTSDKAGYDSTKPITETTNRPYYMKESLAAQADVPSNKVIDFTKNPIINSSAKFNIELEKRSANEALTKDNSCYSLAGATYTLYKGTKEASTEHLEDIYKKKVKVSDGKTVLNKDGKAYVTFSNLAKLPTNNFYFIEETAASKSFGKDSRVFAIYVKEGTTSDLLYNVWYSDNPTRGWYTGLTDQSLANKGTISLNKVVNGQRTYSEETPLDDPFNLQLQKLDKDTGKPVAQGTASLEGAVFEIKYFDNTDEKTDGTPKKVWYFGTDENGEFYATREDYLVNNDTYKSDELYRDNKSKVIYPLGTYLIKEVQAPKKYQLSGTMNFVNQMNKVDVKKGLALVIAQNEKGEAYYKTGDVPIEAENLMLDVYEKVYKGDIQIVKLDENNDKPLQGVEFKLVGDDGTVIEDKTNEDGKLSFTNLIPQHYILTETKTVEGHQLLKDPVDITVPLEFTADEAKKQKLDTSKAVWDENTQTWCFYSQTCQITNTVEFEMPFTGGSSIPYIPMVLAFILIGTGILAFRMKRK